MPAPWMPAVFLYAFDLIELNGDDLRRGALDTRKAPLASLLKRAEPGLWLNEHIEARRTERTSLMYSMPHSSNRSETSWYYLHRPRHGSRFWSI
jgi:ATP-dependent DNA ligase